MFISRIRSNGKDGKLYVSVLLRESKRVGKKVVSQTLAILTDLPEWLLSVVERAVKDGKDANSLKELADASNLRLGMRCGESFGAVFLVYELARICGITQALGASEEAKLTLWQVLARTLSPATSLLAMVRLAGTCAAPSLLGFKAPFNEDDLYANGAWIEQCQPKVETKLWHSCPKDASKSDGLFCMM